MLRRFVCASLALSVLACSGDNEGDGGGGGGGVDGAPALPEIGTLTVDLTLSDGGLNLDDPARFAAEPAINYASAAAVILNVSNNIAAPLRMPVEILRAASRSTPMLIEDGAWLWSFDAETSEGKRTANLVAKPNDAGRTAWSLRVAGRDRDFEYLTGEVEADGTGKWQLYDPTAGAGRRVLAVYYEQMIPNAKSLRFDVNSDRSSSLRFGRGSTVAYDVEGDAVRVEVQDSSELGMRLISWKRSTRAGSHVDPQGTKTCWAERERRYANVPCD